MDSQEIRLVINHKEVLMDAIQYYRILADVVVNIYEVLYSFYVPLKFHGEMNKNSINAAMELIINDLDSLEILISGTEYENNAYFSSYSSSVEEVIEKIQAYRDETEVDNNDSMIRIEEATRDLHNVTDKLLQYLGSVSKEKGIYKESQSMVAKRFYNKDFDGN